MVSKRSEHCLVKRKTNILDSTRQEFGSVPVICSAGAARKTFMSRKIQSGSGGFRLQECVLAHYGCYELT